MTRIVLDPGHGGSDPGAVSRGYLEKDIALAISKKLKWALDSIHTSTLLTRDSDIRVGLTERCTFANSRHADLFISIHLNADPDDDSPGTREAKGAEIWHYPGSKKSGKLAAAIAGQFKTNFPDEPFRGVKEGDLAVCRMTTMPAVLIEVGFIDNSDTARWLSEEQVQWDMAGAIASGVEAYLKETP